jgi:hypothetical protein
MAYTYTIYLLKSNYCHQDLLNYFNTNITVNYYCLQNYSFLIQDLIHPLKFSRFGNIIDFHYTPHTLGFLPYNHKEAENHFHLLTILIILPLLLKLENFLDTFQENLLLVIKLNPKTILVIQKLIYFAHEHHQLMPNSSSNKLNEAFLHQSCHHKMKQ